MYNSGDAAEQIVRISLEGTEVALKLTGSAAKNIAAMIYAVLKNRDKNKTKGRQRLTAMLKSGKERLYAVLRNMRYEALHNAINKLPETQRRRLILYYFNGLTYSQIAEMEGCKYQTVQDSIYAALNNLKKILK